MRNLTYFVGMSLDGYIAAPDGAIDAYETPEVFSKWLATAYPETLPTHARPYFGLPADAPNVEFDTLVMGRGTYEPALQVGITNPYGHMRQYIVSTTLGKIDDPAVELVDSDPVALVQRLKQEDGKGIWLAGGGKLAAQLMDEIDELVIKSYPVLMGDGVKALADNFRPTHFELTKRENFDTGHQVSWFRRRV
ncbi:dihydrofolate reductase family protein [Nocardia huaxiensis]|uniref:dihydrofolate reductase family protein n=1 Tax=Nocardia huaxiensis TaxID=2755382 RepID=UPI001E2E72F7|nr:dihydrofolate reductase family protein [Nocardia huaxiensis]UFS94841.1 dihydrofolate reductase family protein [Nocardia huaxiensis]